MKWIIPFCVLLLMTACTEMNNPLPTQLGQNSQAIVNGVPVTGNEHLATTMLAYDVAENMGESFVSMFGKEKQFCSSTLITPNYVLTAAHCICNNDYEYVDLDHMRYGIHVYVAQSTEDIRNTYDIEAFYPHPDYTCNKSVTLTHDIAILKLKTPVPLSVAKPIAPLPPSLAITADEVTSADGIEVVDVGFGRTYDETEEHSAKHKMTSTIYAYCPIDAPATDNCLTPVPASTEYNGKPYSYDYYLKDGFLYTRRGYGSHSSTCPGDSGGSTYLTRGNIPYLAGIHSHVSSYDCNDGVVNGDTIVSDYYDSFIRTIVTDLPSDTPETDCSNHQDDNNDGRTDCEDPWCFHLPVCATEICNDNIDNDENGATDCEDTACANDDHCIKEICDDDIDNNHNNLKDCEDPDCFNHTKCQPEICNDNIDNNDNGKADCLDPACADHPNCLPENCSDGIDNNHNNLKDCDDPLCANDPKCNEEICDDKIDNNNDNLVDCNDPLCAERYVCNPYTPGGPVTHKEKGCSTTVRQTPAHSLWLCLLAVLSLLGIGTRRSSKSSSVTKTK